MDQRRAARPGRNGARTCSPPRSTGRAPAEHRQSTGRAPAEHRQSTGRAPAEHRQSTGRAPGSQGRRGGLQVRAPGAGAGVSAKSVRWAGGVVVWRRFCLGGAFWGNSFPCGQQSPCNLNAIPGSYRQTTTSRVAGQIVQEETFDGFGRTISVKAPVSTTSAGNAILFNSQSGWDSDGKLAWRSRPQPSGWVLYEVWKHFPATGEVQSGLSLDTALVLGDDTFLRSSITVDGTSVYMAWRTVSRTLPTATGTGWESTPAPASTLNPAIITRTALAARPVSASWSGHNAGAMPQEYRNDGGTIYTQAVERSWASGILNSQRRVIRHGRITGHPRLGAHRRHCPIAHQLCFQ